MCDGAVKIQPGYGVFNCQCGFKRSVAYPAMRGEYSHPYGTRKQWVEAKLMSIVSIHMGHVKARA